MKKKPTIDPETRALWRENRRRVEALLQRRLERDRELAELEERRRARLRRLTFGLLGRSQRRQPPRVAMSIADIWR